MPKRVKKTTRNHRGMGTCFFHEGRQRFVARKTVRGVRLERWGETKAEAIASLAKALPPDPNTVTVKEWAERWRAAHTGRASTRDNVGVSLDLHILPALGDLRLVDVKTHHVEALIANLSNVAQKAPGTVGKVIDHARAMFTAAVHSDLIPKNPATRARKPRTDAPEIQTYTPAELGKIISASQDFASGPIIATLAGTGLRVGEALALDVGDWNPTAGTLSVTKTYSKEFGTGDPKSQRSRRTVTVPWVLWPILNDAVKGRTAGPLFPTGTGARGQRQKVGLGFRRTLKRAKLPPRKLHSLRHSVATHLIGANVPLPDVARYLGDTVATLVKFYVHPTWADPAHTLNVLYGGQKVGDPTAPTLER